MHDFDPQRERSFLVCKRSRARVFTRAFKRSLLTRSFDGIMLSPMNFKPVYFQSAQVPEANANRRFIGSSGR